MWQVLLGTLFFATLLNGIYPAVLLSSFKPLNVFRGKTVLKIRDGSIRKGLVIFQFSLSMALIIGTMVIYRQLQFIQTSNPGYNVSQVMSIEIPWRSYGNLKGAAQQAFFSAIKLDLQSESSVQAVSSGSQEIVNITGTSSGNANWIGRDTSYKPTVARLSADDDFQKMFQVKMASGRWFGKDKADERNYILNETAASAFNMQKPILGQLFIWGGDTGRVIGIVKDFHYKSMHDKIGPMVIRNKERGASYFFIKTVSGNAPKTIAAVQKIWYRYIPAEPFSFNFLDDSFNNLYKTDIKTSKLIFIFSSIAVIISALGLFGLAAFTAERRTKEIGIRKVLGASVQQIATLLSRDFVMLVIIAIVISSPVAWFFMNKWLENFAYRINISVWIFIAAASLALFIAIFSVSFQAIKAATTNPVVSLRAE
jgi:ABC-type antimicrobial peptide transport system permease subunit